MLLLAAAAILIAAAMYIILCANGEDRTISDQEQLEYLREYQKRKRKR